MIRAVFGKGNVMLSYLFKALSAAFDAVAIAVWGWNPALAILAGFGVYINLQVLYLIFLYIWSLFLPNTKEKVRYRPVCAFMTRVTIDWLLDLFHVVVKTQGLEKLPGEPFVLVQNHRSRFDPMIVYHVLRGRKKGFISKKENMKIPIAGSFIHNAGFLPMDRENALQSMRTLRQAANMVKNEGFCMTIYPEGTRNKFSQPLLDFKEGAFYMAKKAGAPIVVTVVENTASIAPHFYFFNRVPFKVLSVIPKETVAEKSDAELAEICRGIMLDALR